MKRPLIHTLLTMTHTLRLALWGLGFLLVIALPARAQKTVHRAAPPASVASAAANCNLGAATADLDIGRVRAQVYNMGGLFWRGGGAIYEAPYDARNATAEPNALFAAGLWVSGEVDGAPRFAGSTYGNWEFWPGPLDATGETTASRCASFDKIWRVSVRDLAAYGRSGITAQTNPDLLSWPIAQGAPYFVDTNGNDRRDASEPRIALGPGDAGYSLTLGGGAVLDLAAGERPDLVGDQAAWWVMNDNGNLHNWSGSQPLGIEVQVLAYGFTTPDVAVSTATVYEYTILNRGTNTIIDSRVSLWSDPDIGNFGDDYVGSDAARGMGFAYNGDEDDEGAGGYGAFTPAIGIDLLSSAAGTIAFTNNGGVTGDPSVEDDRRVAAWLAQQSLWKDGEPITRGGDGYNPGSSDVTTWAFDGDPLGFEFWTEEQPVVGEPQREAGDRRIVVNAPAVTLAPGESRQVDVAILFAAGARARTRLASVSRLRDISDAVQAAYDADGTRGIRDASVTYGAAPARPDRPTLVSPANGTDFETTQPASVTFEWTAVPGAAAYVLDFGNGTEYTVAAPATSLTLDAATQLPQGEAQTRWGVRAVNWGGESRTSFPFTYTYNIYNPSVLLLSNGSPAFVEVVGPGGADPCGPDAGSTFGCSEVGGNAIFSSFNGTGDYIGTAVGAGPEVSLADFAPNDYEIRFTAAGSYAYYPFTTGVAIWVPFEVWDIGVTAPGAINDPLDDVQMIPNLFPDSGVECTFDYQDPTVFGIGETTQRIYAYYPVGDYATWAAAIAPVIAADPNQCPTDPATAAASNEIDFSRGRPLQRFKLEQAGAEISGLTGTVIRFYTTDPTPLVAPSLARAEALRVATHPNPVTTTATVPYTLAEAGPVRLRVVDVLGREVAVLADGLQAAGDHSATLDATGLAAGVYVLVLDADGQRTSQSITVVR